MTSDPKKMVILHIISNHWYSALTEYALCATLSLEQQGIKSVIWTKKNSPAEKKAKELGIWQQSFDSFNISKWFSFKKSIQALNPTHIFFYEGKESFLGLLLKPLYKSIKMIRFYGRDLENTSTTKLSFFKKKLSNIHIDQILTPSIKIKNKVSYDGSPTISTIPLGRCKKTFNLPKHSGNKPEAPTLLFLGRLDPIKGHFPFLLEYKKLLSIWNLAKNEIPFPTLHIIGEPKNISLVQLNQQIDKLGLKKYDCIKISTKYLPSIEKIIRNASIGIIFSQGSEVICRTGEEFLMCGVPILITDIGALGELTLASRKDSLLTSIHPSNKFTKKLKDFIVNAFHENFLQRSERSQIYVDKYSLEKMGKNLLLFLS